MKFTLLIALAVTFLADPGLAFDKEGKSDLKWYLDCYWRQYLDGEIPSDAVQAGHDMLQRPTYIGQALVYTVAFNQTIYAEVPFNLNPFTETQFLGVGGPIAVQSHIKILCCASEKSVEWVRTTPERIFFDLANRKPVLGGQQLHLEEPIKHDLLIGRTLPSKEQIVGKILMNNADHVIFYYVNGSNTAMLRVSPYEVLVYKA
ncbi:unnamed protein product [Acanthoscelides obtectus]|uniref:Uncharacterized protein n=1 Tax=Acanthoscelides obtectus TaxID=200917 RepID=A0A9P0K4Q6_ACAOB|nr:unnamed protein product [Acanthoscelides obtectus]CAK1676771.1 hypothetical protein AOBTE_LOCUS30931 [Acanthoscelides obtectus]